MMGFPLRLLAREIYDRVVAIKGVAQVALITGEERIEPPNARWHTAVRSNRCRSTGSLLLLPSTKRNWGQTPSAGISSLTEYFMRAGVKKP